MTFEKPALWTRNFVFIAVINFFLFCSFQMHPVALPPYVKGLGAADHLLGWVTGISIVSALIVRPFAGLALDRMGRKPLFLAGMAVMLLMNAALYFLPLVGAVLAIRFVYGLGWGVAGTASSTVATDFIPKERMGEGMAYFSLSVSLSLAVAPALALSMSPGMMFAVSGAFALLAIGLACRLNYRKLAPLPAANPAKLAPYEKSAVPAAVLMGLVNVTYGALVTFIAVHAAEKGIANIGPFFLTYAITMVLVRPPLGKLIDRKGFGIVVLPGLALLCLAMALISRADSMPFFLLCSMVYAVGQGALHISAMSLSVVNAPRDRLGAANATFFTGFDAGIGLGAVLAGLLASRHGYSDMFLFMALAPCVCAAVYLLVKKRGKPGLK